MKTFSDTLLQEVEVKLAQIQQSNQNPIEIAKQSIKTCKESIVKLKSHFKEYTFQNKHEEIEFFKMIKPQFESKIIFYNQIFNIEICKPKGTPKTIRKYYNTELQKIKTYFKENIEFYKYYRSNNKQLDKIYFLRKRNKFKQTIDDDNYIGKFATSHDFKVAKIIAIEKIQDYIESKLKNSTNTETTIKSKTKILNWTGSKVALVELIYALQTQGVINNGKLSLTEIAFQFETIFNLEIGQFHRIFIEIRNRKTIEKTSFLDTLKENLIKRIQEADEK
ncbi:RteC domain-containing protein [Flavobacterium sp.]|uniref:RteC domain-containing protein n=1 Tax=Flavobacterium sp. TaxID=239 RepID=UPI0037529F3D